MDKQYIIYGIVFFGGVGLTVSLYLIHDFICRAIRRSAARKRRQRDYELAKFIESVIEVIILSEHNQKTVYDCERDSNPFNTIGYNKLF